ncbi:hypothetical protein POSPLADRAFT_1074277, partial [Postia placenta MAD-698-R-SB12]
MLSSPTLSLRPLWSMRGSARHGRHHCPPHSPHSHRQPSRTTQKPRHVNTSSIAPARPPRSCGQRLSHSHKPGRHRWLYSHTPASQTGTRPLPSAQLSDLPPTTVSLRVYRASRVSAPSNPVPPRPILLTAAASPLNSPRSSPLNAHSPWVTPHGPCAAPHLLSGSLAITEGRPRAESISLHKLSAAPLPRRAGQSHVSRRGLLPRAPQCNKLSTIRTTYAFSIDHKAQGSSRPQSVRMYAPQVSPDCAAPRWARRCPAFYAQAQSPRASCASASVFWPFGTLHACGINE